MDTAATAFLMAAPMPNGKGEVVNMNPSLYFEDMEPGRSMSSQPQEISKQELVAFAKVWDPLPIHVDEEAGVKVFGSLTAPGLYMLAIKQRLIHTLPILNVIASLGYDEVRFHAPLRPGDTVTLKMEWISRRESNSKPDRGIVVLKFTLINQDGLALMSHLDTILVKRKLDSGSAQSC